MVKVIDIVSFLFSLGLKGGDDVDRVNFGAAGVKTVSVKPPLGHTSWAYLLGYCLYLLGYCPYLLDNIVTQEVCLLPKRHVCDPRGISITQEACTHTKS